MTEHQRKHIERRLLEERERVVQSLARYAERTATTDQDQDADLSNFPSHLADEGTDTMQQELDAALAERESRQLTEIDEALRRFYQDPGRFGKDERSGEEIPFERLDIIPWARTTANGG
jgi:RNA polymerase-binding transcription factor DksA